MTTYGTFLVIALSFAFQAIAAPAELTYQGRIVKSDGSALEHHNVSFQFEITNPNGTCILYREQVDGINMQNSNGIFDVAIGASHSYPASASFTILDSFSNSNPLTCDGGSPYNPASDDGRRLRVQFHDGGSWRVISPDSIIRSVPYSAYSSNAGKLGDYFAVDYLRKNEINGNANCLGGSFLTWNAATGSFGCAIPAGGTGSLTEVTSSNSFISVANSTSTPTLTLNVGNTANTVAIGNDPRFSNARNPTGAAAGDLTGSYPNPTVAKIQGVEIDSGAPASGQVLQFNGLIWTPTSLPSTSSGTVTSVQSANSYLTITDASINPILTLNVGNVANTVAAGNDPRFTNSRAPNGTASGDLSGNYPSPSVAKIRGINVDVSAPTTGQVLKYDGTSWVPSTLTTGNAGTVTSITAGTGLTGGTITSSGTIGLDAELTGLAGIASNGYLQRTAAGAYSTTAGSPFASSDTLVVRDNSGVAGFYGINISGASSGNVSLLAPNITNNYSLTFPAAQGGSNQVLRNNGSGILSWASIPTAPGTNCGLNEVITYSGGSFSCVPDQTGSAGSGITTFNGLTGSSQSLGPIGTAGVSPEWVSASSVHTLNIPLANTASVTAGLISKAEYDVFNGKQNALGYTPLKPSLNLSDVSSVTTARTNLGLGTAATRNIAASGNAATTEVVMGNDTRLTNARTPSGAAGGDLSGTYPNPGVAKLSGTDLGVNNLTTGDYLKYDGAKWVNAVIGVSDISGLSTSLGNKLDQTQISGSCTAGTTLVYSTLNNTWSCSNIAVTSAQVSFGSQTANRVFAAPNGSNGNPSFRALVEADLPSSITQGAWDVNGSHVYRPTGSVGIGIASPTQVLDIYRSNANTFVRIANDSSTANRDVGMVIENYRGANFGSDNYFYFRNAQGSMAAPTATKNGNTLGGFYFQGQGTTAGTWRSGAAIIAAAATGGVDFTDTNSATDLVFQTNDGSAFATRMTLDATGKLGIGTSAPASALHVIGGVQVGNDSATCAAAKAGTIRYASGTMSLCNGSSWVAFSSTVGTVTSVAAGSGLSGGTITTSGTIAVAANGITSAMILDGTIGAADIGTNAITASELASNSVTSAKITDLSIVDGDLAAALSNRIWSGGNGTAVWHTTGNVGIGTTAPGYDLHVNGDIAGVAFLHTSDRRLKTNIKTLENPLVKVLALRGVSYNWKSNNKPDLGFIAQEVEEIVPDAVSTRVNDKGEDTKSVKYGNLVGLLVEAIKEMYQHISNTDSEVEMLKAENSELKNRLQSLEERFKNLESRQPASVEE